jgi:hypothetical protein
MKRKLVLDEKKTGPEENKKIKQSKSGDQEGQHIYTQERDERHNIFAQWIREVFRNLKNIRELLFVHGVRFC